MDNNWTTKKKLVFLLMVIWPLVVSFMFAYREAKRIVKPDLRLITVQDQDLDNISVRILGDNRLAFSLPVAYLFPEWQMLTKKELDSIKRAIPRQPDYSTTKAIQKILAPKIQEIKNKKGNKKTLVTAEWWGPGPKDSERTQTKKHSTQLSTYVIPDIKQEEILASYIIPLAKGEQLHMPTGRWSLSWEDPDFESSEFYIFTGRRSIIFDNRPNERILVPDEAMAKIEKEPNTDFVRLKDYPDLKKEIAKITQPPKSLAAIYKELQFYRRKYDQQLLVKIKEESIVDATLLYLLQFGILFGWRKRISFQRRGFAMIFGSFLIWQTPMILIVILLAFFWDDPLNNPGSYNWVFVIPSILLTSIWCSLWIWIKFLKIRRQRLQADIETTESWLDQTIGQIKASLAKYPDIEQEIFGRGKAWPLIVGRFPELKSNEALGKELDVRELRVNAIYKFERKINALDEKIARLYFFLCPWARTSFQSSNSQVFDIPPETPKS